VEVERRRPWLDGVVLAKLLAELPDDDYYEGLPNREDLSRLVQLQLIALIEGNPSSDVLTRIAEKVDRSRVDAAVLRALDVAIQYEIEEVESVIAEMDSASTLEEHMEALGRLGPIAGIPVPLVKRAVDQVKSRIVQLKAETEEAAAPVVPSSRHSDLDDFSDAELSNQFASLATIELTD
jgi:hypothetical protein